jgi:hypothetical protein
MALGENVLWVALAMACRLMRAKREDPTGPPTLGHQLWWHNLVACIVTVYRHFPALLLLLLLLSLLLSLVVCQSDTVVVMTSTNIERWRREVGRRRRGSDERAARSGGYERGV